MAGTRLGSRKAATWSCSRPTSPPSSPHPKPSSRPCAGSRNGGHSAGVNHALFVQPHRPPSNSALAGPLHDLVAQARLLGNERGQGAPDLDLFVVGRVDQEELSDQLADAERALGRDVNVVSCERAELDELRSEGDRFVTDVLADTPSPARFRRPGAADGRSHARRAPEDRAPSGGDRRGDRASRRRRARTAPATGQGTPGSETRPVWGRRDGRQGGVRAAPEGRERAAGPPRGPAEGIRLTGAPSRHEGRRRLPGRDRRQDARAALDGGRAHGIGVCRPSGGALPVAEVPVASRRCWKRADGAGSSAHVG